MKTVSKITEESLPILLIGGTDPSGAGLQVDWKVVNALGVEASSIVTAVTAQNADMVFDSGVLSSQQFKAQLDAVKTEKFSAVKIGMLGNEKIIKPLIDYLDSQSKSITDSYVILDPVLVASSGGKLLTDKGIALLLSKLLPLTTLITPNLDELALLTNLPINNQAEIEHASKQLIALGATSVLVKGGHSLDAESSTDLLITASSTIYLMGKRWKDRKNVRGTGCALATTIAVMMSKGYCLEDAVILAKANLSRAIRHAVINRGGQRKLRFKAGEDLHIDLQDFPKLITTKAQKITPDFLSCGSKSLGIYPVVDSVEWVKKLVPLGIETIQLRIKTETETETEKPKNQSIEEMEQRAEQQIQEAITFCNAYKVRLFINDHWRIAIKHKAYGIHLGQEDLAKLSNNDLQSIADAKCRLGVSTHSFFEVARAHQLKPSYIALGPIFATTSKVMPWIPQGVAAVKMWVHLLGDAYPLVAIGGINAKRAKALKATGVGSVAMITAITEADDYEKATKDLLLLWGG